MKTLMGARLNDMRPYEVGGATYAQAAFRWVLSNPDVDGLIVSMTSNEAINEFVAASGFRALESEDLPLLQRYAQLNAGSYCRNGCNTCQESCPYGVAIPDVLRTRMYAVDYHDTRMARSEYAMITRNATACLSCSGRPCAGACPYGVRIAELTAATHLLLTG
jgi:predicted aldo/keto reductase-like oxidoreductase